MRKAWLVVNHFLHSQKFNQIHHWLVESGIRKGIELVIKTNSEVSILLDYKASDWDKPEFVLFWDKDIYLAKYLEMKGLRLFNSASSIEACDDKALTHLKLYQEKIPMPKTILAPKTFEGIGYGDDYTFLNLAEVELGYPMIVKECFGSFGEQVYLAKDREACIFYMKQIGTKPMLFQEFIKTSFGRDVRIQVVGGEVVAAMYRYSESGDFRANITNGGSMKPYSPTWEQNRLAIHCCESLGLDFAGVDLLFGMDDTPIVCEVNSNAHFKNIFDCTGINAADMIMDDIIKKI